MFAGVTLTRLPHVTHQLVQLRPLFCFTQLLKPQITSYTYPQYYLTENIKGLSNNRVLLLQIAYQLCKYLLYDYADSVLNLFEYEYLHIKVRIILL